MHPRKEQYATEIYRIIDRFFEANAQIKEPKSSKALPAVLGISTDETQKIINKIMIALPDWIFYMLKPIYLDEMLSFIAQQYFLFQIQENIKDELFPILLINFINSLIEELMKRYYA